jgi:hypothetical protein
VDDLEHFERLIEADDADGLREALALWRGAPLADFPYEAFMQASIGRLEELHLAALEKRIEADLAGGRHAFPVDLDELGFMSSGGERRGDREGSKAVLSGPFFRCSCHNQSPAQAMLPGYRSLRPRSNAKAGVLLFGLNGDRECRFQQTHASGPSSSAIGSRRSRGVAGWGSSTERMTRA